MAGSVEGLLKGRHGRVEGAVIDLTSLRHSLLGKGTHALWNGRVEIEETELGRHIAVCIAGLVGGSLGIVGGVHKSTGWVSFAWQPPNRAPLGACHAPLKGRLAC